MDEPQEINRPRRRTALGPLALRTSLVVAMAALCTVFFGLCVPFFLLAMKVLPSLSYAGVVYLFAGGLFGLLFGGITSAVSLSRSERPITRYYAALFISVAVLTAAYYVAYLHIDALQHV